MVTNYLIVEQHLKPPENLPEILKELTQRFQLDTYQCRQRLTGRGMSLLAKGNLEQLDKISVFLQQTGFTHWLVEPSKKGFVPLKISNLQINSERITFGCQKKEVAFPRGATILAIFAETTGELADKSVAQLLSSHAYRGKDDVRHLEQNKIYKIILQGKPVLDLYHLDNNLQVKDAVRIFPGKFDPQGLGDRASLSSRQNLQQILQLAEEYAGDFYLHTDFGLTNLPGCTLRRDNSDNPETQRLNLLSLARYGWLMVDLLQSGAINSNQAETENDLAGSVATAMLLQNPALAADGPLEEILPLAKEISSAINGATRDEKKPTKLHPKTADIDLPAPPPAKSTARWSNPKVWLSGAGIAIIVGASILSDIFNRTSIKALAYHSFASGAIPMVIAILMLWYGFYFLRLKRRVENTPTSKIRSVAMGMVEIKGQAIRSYALISPMSNTPCVYYRLTKYRRDRNRQWQVSSSSGSNNVPFLLEDETGRVEINPTGGHISAGSKHEGVPGQVGLMLSSNSSDEKWVEETIVDGTLLYILGYAAVKHTHGTSLNEQKISALRELKQDQHKLQRFDRDGDGKISADEWDDARNAIEAEVIAASLQNKQQRKRQEDHIVVGKKPGRPLIIAETHSEDNLTTRYFYYGITLFSGAVAATGAAIYLLINYLN